LENINEQLCEGNKMEMFVTCYLAILTISTGELVYSNAGHEYPAVQRVGGPFEIIKEKHSPPLAVMEGIRFRSGQMYLSPGDALFVYTDGITEATNSSNELFGLDRLTDALNMDSDATAKEIDTNVRNAVNYFVGDAPQFDDMTTLCLRYYGN
jgi:serine phosphatase RsbU (regulator of sigma subunit)